MEHTKGRLSLRVGIAFAALAVGFVGAVVYVPLALRPVALRAEGIQHNLAEAVRALADLRGYGRDVRTEALLAYQAQGDREIEPEVRLGTVASWRAKLRELAEAYARLPRTAEEETIWREVRERDLPDLDRAVARMLTVPSRPGGDPDAVQQLLDVGAALDANLQQLVRLNAEETGAESSRIHAAMRRLSLAYVVVAVLGGVGGLLLVAQVVRLLRSYAAAMARRVAELEAFAGQISHDLRTPLQTVHLAVASIEKRADDAPSVRRLSSKALSGLRRLDHMIRELLQFARSGAEARENERCDVPALVDELAGDLGPAAERVHVALTMRAEPGIIARMAPIALKTVLTNLVENAIKYRRPEGENRVDVNANAKGDLVQLRVEDGGIGIPAGALPRIFEPFFRATQRVDSHGLGLPTVKRLVEQHGGTISVQSTEGRGTTFVVTLPRATPEGPPPLAAERGSGAGAPAQS